MFSVFFFNWINPLRKIDPSLLPTSTFDKEMKKDEDTPGKQKVHFTHEWHLDFLFDNCTDLVGFMPSTKRFEEHVDNKEQV